MKIQLKNSHKIMLISSIVSSMLMFASAEEAMPTAITGVTMDGELPSKESVEKIFDEMDYHRATQAYLWAYPIVVQAKWNEAQAEFGAKNGDLVYYDSFDEKLGILTPNSTTPYFISFVNLKETGPLVIDLPPGYIAGSISDYWQREMSPMGEMGPDKGKGGKFVMIPPENTQSFDKDYYPVPIKTFNAGFGLRALDPDKTKALEMIKQIKVYPYGDTPKAVRIVSPEGKKWSQIPPSGLEYWALLHKVIQEEKAEERDKFFLAMLQELGIEKGKPFNPTEKQKAILIKATKTGHLMAQANAFQKRIPNIKHWDDRKWDYVMIMENPDQTIENRELLAERTAYFYEAVSYGKSMISKTPDVGQAYLGSYSDVNGNWLRGDKNYVINIPNNPPALNFWSITIYDSETRFLIDNPTKKADVSSRENIIKNADGSVDLYIGPLAPKGKESNWIQTIPGKHWFTYLRFYGPQKAYFDKSWKMDDIKEVSSFD